MNEFFDSYDKERQKAMEAYKITEEDANDSASSCIFGNTSYTLDGAIDRMEQRYNDIILRIINLNNGQYSKLSMVRYEIAVGLYLIQREKLYLVSDYNSVFNVASAVLGFSRMQTTNYIKVAERFIDSKKPVSKFYDPKSGIDFGMTQLIQLLKLTDDEIKYCIKTNLLDYTMSVVAVKKVVKDVKDKRKQIALKSEMEKCKPIIDSYESFHKAYNNLKSHLQEIGDSKGADELLPLIMDAVIGFYPKQAFDIKSKWDKARGILDSDEFITLM